MVFEVPRVVVWEGAQGPGRGTRGRGGELDLGCTRTLWSCWCSRRLELPVRSCILPPPCALCALLRAVCGQSCLGHCSAQHCSSSKPEILFPFPVPSPGSSGRSPWMLPAPATPQKLTVLPARRQLPRALTQTAVWFCYCLGAWKSVDSLFCSICYAFGKMLNIVQPEGRTKAGWGFCELAKLAPFQLRTPCLGEHPTLFLVEYFEV